MEDCSRCIHYVVLGLSFTLGFKCILHSVTIHYSVQVELHKLISEHIISTMGLIVTTTMTEISKRERTDMS